MKITEDVRRQAKENAIAESTAIEHGARQKAEGFQHTEQKFIPNHDANLHHARKGQALKNSYRLL